MDRRQYRLVRSVHSLPGGGPGWDGLCRDIQGRRVPEPGWRQEMGAHERRSQTSRDQSLADRDGVIYAGTGDGVYRVAEGDNRWRVVTKGLDETLVHSLVMAPERTLFAGTSGRGVFRYKSTASEWTRLTHGLVDHEGLVENFIRVLAVDKDQALYAGTFDGGVFRSGDGGQTWRPISRALPNDSIRGIVTNERGLFVATGRGIFKSLNQGRQWTPLNHGLTELSVQVLIVSDDGSLYAGTSSGVFRSDDDGEHWVGISTGLAEAGVSGTP